MLCELWCERCECESRVLRVASTSRGPRARLRCSQRTLLEAGRAGADAGVGRHDGRCAVELTRADPGLPTCRTLPMSTRSVTAHPVLPPSHGCPILPRDAPPLRRPPMSAHMHTCGGRMSISHAHVQRPCNAALAHKGRLNVALLRGAATRRCAQRRAGAHPVRSRHTRPSPAAETLPCSWPAAPSHVKGDRGALP